MLLQVVMMPSPGDEIARILTSLGQSLPTIFNREGIERQRVMDMIAANPEYGQQIAGQVRMASAEGATDAAQPGLTSIGETLGLDMGNADSQALLASISESFPATLQEQIGALATGATVGAAASPTAQLTHEAATKGLEADVQRSTTEIITGLNEQERQEVLRDLNYPQLLAQYEMATARLGIEDTAQKMEAWKQLDKFIKENPELAGQEAAGLVNPAFLDYLSLLERLSLEERLQMAKKASDPLEVLGSVISLGQERNRLWNSIREAKAAGASDEEMAALNAQWNDVDTTGQLVASTVPGLEWSTIALPGAEKDPITYSTPTKWTEYTTTHFEAEQAAVMDNLLSSYTEWMRMELAGGRDRSELLTELKQDDPEFWNTMMSSGALGEWMAEINRWVTEETKKSAKETEVQRGEAIVKEDIERRTRIPR